MAADPILGWLFPSLLLSLRIAPVFAFAPPFTLVPAPPLFRALFGLGLAACLAFARPQAVALDVASLAAVTSVAARELMLGAVFVVALQFAFAALALAGRTIDIQSGLGMAVLIDPTTKGQSPLVGTVFAYAAGAVFFALDGHVDLMRICAASLEAMPLGQERLPASLVRLTSFMSAVSVTAFGVAGATILCLFLADLAIAALSRTAPQMNVLVLGFQLKTILLLVALPVTFGFAGALLARVTSLTLQALPGLL